MIPPGAHIYNKVKTAAIRRTGITEAVAGLFEWYFEDVTAGMSVLEFLRTFLSILVVVK